MADNQHKPNPLEEFFGRTSASRSLKRSDLTQVFYSSVLIFMALVLLISGRLDRFEYNLLDYFFQKRPPIETHDSIVTIDIAEDSLQAIGLWPWPWHYHAEMIKILNDWGAKAIVFDMIFKEDNAPYENDELAKVLKDTNQVYFPVSLESRSEKKIWVHSIAIPLEPRGQKKAWIHSAPNLEQHLKGVGHHHAKLDKDGVFRRVKPVVAQEDESYPHIALQVAYDALGETMPEAKDLPGGGKEFFVNWPGPWKDAYKHYSYADVVRSYQSLNKGIKPIVDPKELRGKICIVGLTATENANLLVTPIEGEFPRIGIHANIINGILTKQFMRPASRVENSFCLVFLGLLATFLFLNFHNMKSLAIGIALVGSWIGVAFLLFFKFGIWIYIFQPLMLIMALFIAAAIYAHIVASKEQKRLFDLATRDGLTGLYVIRYFREILNQVVRESLDTGTPLSLILTDIDNFKKINDTYGHPAGDMVLKKTAQTLESCLRSKRPTKESDFAARYGGEEFIVLLRNSPLDDAAKHVGERIRAAVEKNHYDWEGKTIKVTISIGVAALHMDENVPDFMVRRADEALYEAKRTGKNKVCKEKLTP